MDVAEEGANYFQNIVSEHNANPRMLIVHEVMGRNCGWLTAYTAKIYRDKLNKTFLSEIDYQGKIRYSWYFYS